MTTVSEDLRFTAGAALAFLALAAGVHHIQVPLAERLHVVKETDDVYPFPPPALLRMATLGYVSATTDVLWGRLLVENGVHWSEHRAFPDLEHYLDAVIGLEPTFHPLYEFVDSLLCYRPMNGHELEAREARAYLERGTQELPNDSGVWREYGQFLAFMGPSYLADEEEKKQWRHDGAVALQHAVDLGADMQLGIAASAVLESRLGERQAAIAFLERAYALTEDDAERKDILARLELLHAGQAADCARDTIALVDTGWRRDFPFVDRGTYMLLTPAPPAFRCVGPASSREPGCERDWETLRPPCQ
jgi:hypothetical protein